MYGVLRPIPGANTYFGHDTPPQTQPPPALPTPSSAPAPAAVTYSGQAPIFGAGAPAQNTLRPTRPMQRPPALTMPITGANTTFGQQSASPRGHQQHAHHQQGPANGQSFPSPIDRAVISPFGQFKNQAKIGFEQELGRRLSDIALAYSNLPRPASAIASKLTSEIDKIRQEKKEGFLPDNHHWMLLQRQLESDRFVAAAVAGHLTAKFLGGTNSKDLEMRIQTLEGLPKERFRELLKHVRPSEEPHVSTTFQGSGCQFLG